MKTTPSESGAPERFYHATPLHYAPAILASGFLCSQRTLGARVPTIRPRVTAFRRDRKLHLDGYVHFAFTAVTPLLLDKARRGYPHIVFEFAAGISDLDGAAFLKFNPKSWRHRDDFLPVTCRQEKASFLRAWSEGSYPSAELLVPGPVPLAGYCVQIIAPTEEALAGLLRCADAVNAVLPAPIQVGEAFSLGPPIDLAPYTAYLEACIAARAVLPPPDLPFD